MVHNTSERIYRTLAMRAGYLFALPAAPIVGGLLALAYLAKPDWAALATIGVGIVAAYVLYGTAHTIVLRESDASVEFRSVFRTRVVRLADIRAIEFARLLKGELVVVHAGGAERMTAGFAGVEDVVGWIRHGNPEIRIPAVFDR